MAIHDIQEEITDLKIANGRMMNEMAMVFGIEGWSGALLKLGVTTMRLGLGSDLLRVSLTD